jgi:hypothetical protein
VRKAAKQVARASRLLVEERAQNHCLAEG